MDTLLKEQRVPEGHVKASHAPAGGFLDELGGSVLICKACGAVITRPEWGMVIEGSQRHVFFNPQGMVFEIGCFATARNLRISGPKTEEFTWFPDYAWQVAVCTGCGIQLGWRYMGRLGGFYGLILTGLETVSDRDG